MYATGLLAVVSTEPWSPNCPYVSPYAIHQAQTLILYCAEVPTLRGNNGNIGTGIHRFHLLTEDAFQFDCKLLGASDCLLVFVLINTSAQWSHGPGLASLGAASVHIIITTLNCLVLRGKGWETLRNHLLMLL